jgi:SAM-dependent methyltransferase
MHQQLYIYNSKRSCRAKKRISASSNGFLSEDKFPMEMKGSGKPHLKHNTKSVETLREIWDQHYVNEPSWWKGPYDLSPIMQRLTPGARVLDVGCGSGRYLVPLVRNGFEAVGADISRHALESLGSQYVCLVADVCRLPFSDSQFDAVTCYGVLEHLTQIGCVRAATEVFRILTDRGLAFFEVTGLHDVRNPSGVQKDVYSIVRRGIPHHYFSPAELCTIFESAGFVVLALDEKINLKWYAGVASRRHRILVMVRRP